MAPHATGRGTVWLAYAGLVLACAVAVAAQESAPRQDQQAPPIRSAINFVSVDAIVTDRKTGAPVTGLTAADFEVFEDGERQTIETFRVIALDDPSEAHTRDAAPIRSLDHQAREMQRDDVRIVAIFLDDYHVERGNDLAVREKLAAFVQQLHPRDLVAVVSPMTPATDLVFTRNHEAVARALMTFQGRKFDYFPRNEYEGRYAVYPPEKIELIRTQVTLSALRTLAMHLGTLREGRKTILFVSEGMTNSHPIHDLDYVAGAANRGNTSIYTLDPRGMMTDVPDIARPVRREIDAALRRESANSLKQLAHQTGGRAIVGRNDFLAGLRQLIDDSSRYYLLGYHSTRAPADGRFHAIDVRVRRKGVNVRARPGYWALSEDSLARARAAAAGPRPDPPPEITRALSDLAAPERGRPARIWVGTDAGDDAASHVTVTWEASTERDRHAVARVIVTASGPGGTLLFRGAAEADDDAAGPMDGGSVRFEAPAGPTELRLAVEDAEGTTIDTETRVVDVPGAGDDDVVIHTPRLFRALTARDVATIRMAPLTRPVASREFLRRERLLVVFGVAGAMAAPPHITARLLNARGELVTDLPEPAQRETRAEYDLELALAPFAPNDYVLELSATNGDSTARALVPLRIR